MRVASTDVVALGIIVLIMSQTGCSGGGKGTSTITPAMLFTEEMLKKPVPYSITRSPDGTLTAYLLKVTEGSKEVVEIWVEKADGSDKRLIGRHELGARSPMWSPDSQAIAFIIHNGIRIINIAETNDPNRYRGFSADPLFPLLGEIKSWVGNTITFTVGSSKIYQIQDNGTGLHQVNP